MRVTRGRKIKKEPISKCTKPPTKPPTKTPTKPPTKPPTTRWRKIKEEPIADDYEDDYAEAPLQPAIDDAVPSTSSGNSVKSEVKSNSPTTPSREVDDIGGANFNNKFPRISSHFVPLDLAIRIVPDFDSTDERLLPFLRQCKVAESFVRPEQRPFFTLLVRSKITGFASDLIDVYEKYPNNLDKLIAALKLCFPFVFDVNKAFSDLYKQRQEEQESVETFAARISRILYRGIEASNEKSDDIAENVEARALLDRAATSQFINGLRDLKVANVIDKNVPFKEAVSFAIRMDSMLRRFNPQERLEQEPLALGLSGAVYTNAKPRLPNKKFAPYNKTLCNHCGKRGHFEEYCWSKEIEYCRYK